MKKSYKVSANVILRCYIEKNDFTSACQGGKQRIMQLSEDILKYLKDNASNIAHGIEEIIFTGSPGIGKVKRLTVVCTDGYMITLEVNNDRLLVTVVIP